MSNYNTLISAIQSVIRANGNNEITGNKLQAQLLSMISALGFGYQFMGIAYPGSYPGTPDAKIFYIAYQPGTYTNMGGIVVTGLCVLKYSTSWTKEDIPISGGGGADFLTEHDDLTLETVGDTKLLKFANRQYNTTTPNGLGYKILRTDSTFAEQVTDTNTVYEIRYDFDLQAGTVTIPANSVLWFNGGSIKSGTIVGNNTAIYGDYVFNGVTFDGSFEIPQLDVNAEHFANTVDFFGIMKSFSGSKINLGMNIAVTSKNVTLIPKIDLNGNGHTIKVVCIAFDTTANVSIKNCIFDCSIAESSLLHVSNTEGGFLDLFGNATNNIDLQNCAFNSIPGGFTFTYFRNVKNVSVVNCNFTGVLDPENVQDLGGRTVHLYNVCGCVNVTGCKISNCHGIAISGIENNSVDSNFEIRDNYISNIGWGGIAFIGGLVHNVTISNNVIKDVNLVEDEGGAYHSAINIHGFNNVCVSNNTINTPKATGFDFDGSLSGSTVIEKGENARIYGNKIVCRNVIFWVVKEIEIFDNFFDMTAQMTLSGQINVRNNVIKGISSSSTMTLIRPARASGYTFLLDITLYDNNVLIKSSTTSNLWIVSTAGVTGSVKIRNVSAYLESSGKQAQFLNTGNILSFEDGFEIITKRVNLATGGKYVLIPRNKLGALMEIISYSIDGEFTINPEYSVSFGLARPGAAANDTQFGSVALSGGYNTQTKTHSFSSRPNNTQQAQTGTVYMVCPSGGQDVNVTFEFKYLFGYKPYY